MANNQDLYNAAVAGIAGGCSERWITNTSPASYEGFRNAVDALANAIDALIPAAGGVGNDKARVMQSLCQGVMANRLITSSDPADYSDIAAAIVACYTEIITIITPVNPPGSITPWDAVLWCDPHSAGGTPDGSIANPYLTLQDAYDAFILANEVNACTIMVGPGEAGSLILTPLADKQISVVGLAGDAIDTSFAAPVVNIDTVTLDTGSGVVTISFQNCYINVIDSTVGSMAAPGRVLSLSQCQVNTSITCNWTTFAAHNCVIDVSAPQTVTARRIEYRDISFTDRHEIVVSTSLHWDNASERNFGMAGGFIVAGDDTVLQSWGADINAQTGRDDFYTVAGFARVVFWDGLLTAPRNITVGLAGQDAVTIIIDVYEQAHQMVFVDETSESGLYVLNASSSPRRLTFYGTSPTNEMALVGVEQFGTSA